MIRFHAVHEVLDKAKRLNESLAWIFSVDKGVQELIIKLNTEDQLGREGIDSLENSLGEYADFTVQMRSEQGLQVDHVDFKVTGEYWDSWRVTVTNKELIIKVDENRFNELVNELRFSEDHVGLTQANMSYVVDMIRENYIQYVRQQIL